MTCDLELALINVVRSVFQFTKINWGKQVICRELVYLEFQNEKEIIDIAIHPYLMDILTVIPENKIITKGIPFMKDNHKLDAIFIIKLEIVQKEMVIMIIKTIHKYPAFWG